MDEKLAAEIQKESIKDLYDFEISRFMELKASDQNYAFQRYGCTLIYSMEAEKTFHLLQEMGWKQKESLDFYNIGALQCQQENYKEAMKNFEKSESMGCDRPELFFNMALIYENQGNKGKAKQYFQKYIDLSERWDSIPKSLQKELDEVREHLKGL
ncbi:MAG: tetratricopeptide repeat protein [Candidatus Omnitrophica bacterium]|nr:tetratricopeptide repeat protein [Candidatus Omnitrophota bacterium]